jgi:D-3-phosphoglycerate dehydrogenase / 2-oxoglutarate reductase
MVHPIDILVTLSTFGEYSDAPLGMLDNSLLSYRVNDTGKRMTPEQVIEQGKDCVGIIAGVEKYGPETLSALPRLRCISRVGAGIDNIDLTCAAEKGVAVLNTPNAPTVAVAELTLGMILAVLRRLPEVNEAMHRRRWRRIPGRLLSGKTVGVVGLGRIGRRVAELVSAFNARVIGTDPYPDKQWAHGHGVGMVSLPELLGQSDIVTLHAAGGTDPPLIFSHEEFAAMKPEALFINMARGSMADDQALFEALESGHLCGAGLDVFPDEPYTGPLCDHPQVILSPHQATLTFETRTEMETGAAKNIIGYLKNLK